MTYCVGVDLGTSFTAAAVFRGDSSEMVGLGQHRPEIPTVVHITNNGQMLVGETAERRAVTDPEGTVREFKRRLGDKVGSLVREQQWSSVALMTEVLREVLEFVVVREGEPPALVALAHPAAWGPYTLELLREVATRAGAADVQLVPEPVAAALHHVRANRASAGGCFLVYDLGGGTLDVSLVRVHPQLTSGADDNAGGAASAEIVGDPDGLERLGGIDFDEALKDHVEELIDRPLSSFDQSEPRVMRAMAQLRVELVHAKEGLSKDTRVELPLFLPDVPDVVNITRNEFEAAIRDHVAATMAVAARVVERAELSTEERDGLVVLLVGGSSRIPLVARMVAETLKLPTAMDEHPKHAVARGAALVAAVSRPDLFPDAISKSVAADSDEPEEAADEGAPAVATVPSLAGQAVAPRNRTSRRGVRAAVVALTTVAVIAGGVLVLSRGGQGDVAAGENTTDSTGGGTAEVVALALPAAAVQIDQGGHTETKLTATPAAGNTVANPFGSLVVESSDDSVVGASAGAPTVTQAGSSGTAATSNTQSPALPPQAQPPASPTTQATTTTRTVATGDQLPPPGAGVLSAGRYEEGAVTAYYGNWPSCTGTMGQSGGCDRWTSTPGHYYEIRFRGTGIVIYGAKAFNGGQMSFTADGSHSATADSYYDDNANRRQDTAVYYSIAGLPYGDHTLIGTMLPTKNPSNTASPAYVTIDAFLIAG